MDEVIVVKCAVCGRNAVIECSGCHANVCDRYYDDSHPLNCTLGNDPTRHADEPIENVRERGRYQSRNVA